MEEEIELKLEELAEKELNSEEGLEMLLKKEEENSPENISNDSDSNSANIGQIKPIYGEILKKNSEDEDILDKNVIYFN